jgi:hypothetical protein
MTRLEVWHKNIAPEATIAWLGVGRIEGRSSVINCMEHPKYQGIPPAPERQKTTTWKECIHTPMDVLVPLNLSTAKVWMKIGMMTCDVQFFIHPASRKGHMAGMTAPAGERWVVQIVCPMTRADWG